MSQESNDQSDSQSTSLSIGEVAKIRKIQGIFKVLKVCKLRQSTREFVMSLEEQFESRGTLTMAQEDALFNIYERA